MTFLLEHGAPIDTSSKLGAPPIAVADDEGLELIRDLLITDIAARPNEVQRKQFEVLALAGNLSLTGLIIKNRPWEAVSPEYLIETNSLASHPRMLFLRLDISLFDKERLKAEATSVTEAWGDSWTNITDDGGDNFVMAALRTKVKDIIVTAATLSLGHLTQEDKVQFFKEATQYNNGKEFWDEIASQMGYEDDWFHFALGSDLDMVSDTVRSAYDRSLRTTLAAIKAETDVPALACLDEVMANYDIPGTGVAEDKLQAYLIECLRTAITIPSSQVVLESIVKHLQYVCAQGPTEENFLIIEVNSDNRNIPNSNGNVNNHHQPGSTANATLFHELVRCGCNYALRLCLDAQPDFDISIIEPAWCGEDVFEPLSPIQIAILKGNLQVRTQSDLNRMLLHQDHICFVAHHFASLTLNTGNQLASKERCDVAFCD